MSKEPKNYTNNKMGADTVIGLIILLVLFAAGAEVMRPGSEWGEAIENRPRTEFDAKCEEIADKIDNSRWYQSWEKWSDEMLHGTEE